MTTPRWRIADTQLLFDDRPVLLLGGQLHNSTSSSIGGIAEGLRHVRELGGNTVVAPVCWDLTEPVEGEFDFSLVEALLTQADANDLRLVLLWFGAYKNAGSTYAPRWVRADTQRFPRARTSGQIRPAFTYEGQTPSPVLSVFSPELREADARAFEALMSFVAGNELRDRVAMVQIENEIGLLADSRDRSELAAAAWGADVPEAFLAFLDTAPASIAAGLWREAGAPRSGSWSELLGDGWEADEVFMAWAFASYVEALAVRGAAVWPVPFYVNAWLGPQPGQDRAGRYPSGGPASRVLDVWRAAAPSLATRSPDIYIDDAAGVMDAYVADGSPLFVPECRLRAGDAVLSIARGALGWSAFGIDDARAGGQVSQLLEQLTQLEELVTTAQRDGRLAGVVLEPAADYAEVDLGGYRLVGRGTRALFGRMLLDVGVAELPATPELPAETMDGARITSAHDTRPLALVVAEDSDAFLVIGEGLTIDFFHDDGTVEIDSVVAGRFEAGEWMPRAVLNGDERLVVLPTDGIGVVRIRVLRL
ncbi:DUF5597 domain-containing protein [Microbacterium rhizosphaerae]|uniref:DUF5597 domain-containing protein n=1 Tax=Microbacterium rhizosphaerae TaxID=1678237 RepID=A0ABZ0SQT4_9MICO|nr:DUF5597 domain-containing protein [Microbacterium rhizosphaerae]WPR89587.1 DUF5597 domain-containing protein [Microbacterium rhizosphaerae]